MGELDGKVALVTGGLSGIGRAIAELFDQRGARVVVLDAAEKSRDDEIPGNELIKRLRHGGLFVRGDVSQPSTVENAFSTVLQRFNRLDILVNNAGVTVFKPIDALTAEDFDRVMSINVRGTFLCCRHAIMGMREQEGRGVIVNVSSNFAFVGAPEASIYCASKGAVATMTKALALEASPHGIRINALCPGATATEFNRAHRARPEVLESWEAKTPLRVPGQDFLATPQQIAQSALFLATDASSYMTGSCLIVDGGWNAE